MTIETVNTIFGRVAVLNREAATTYNPWRWKASLELGDEIYLWVAVLNKFTKTTVVEFIETQSFAGVPGPLHFIDENGVAHNATNLLADYVIRRADGSWVFAKTGKDATGHAAQYNVAA